MRKMSEKVEFSFPTPTLIKFGDNDYLVLTEIEQRRPRVSFYYVDASNGIYGPPTYTIDGAELFIDCKLLLPDEKN